MLSPEAGELRLGEQAQAGVRALLSVAQLLGDRLTFPEPDALGDSLSPNEKVPGKENGAWSSFD